MTEEQLLVLAKVAGIDIAPPYRLGVMRNFGTLMEQAALLFEHPVDPWVEPAPVFRP